MITGIQVILLSFIALLIIRTFRRVHEGVVSDIGALGWMLIWIIGAGVVILPDSTSRLAEIVGVGRGVDVVVYVGMILVFFLIFKLYNRTVTMEQEITRLVRALALKDDHTDEKS